MRMELPDITGRLGLTYPKILKWEGPNCLNLLELHGANIPALKSDIPSIYRFLIAMEESRNLPNSTKSRNDIRTIFRIHYQTSGLLYP